MKQLAASLVAFFLFALSSSAQQVHIRGSLVDSSEHKILSNSVISILRQADSVLLAFTRTNKEGKFSLTTATNGPALILITHPSYADYIDHIDLHTTAPIDLGNIYMTLKSQLLQEVVVTGNGLIKIKGDTIEYKIDSLHMRAGATVEDMLKKLPGITVDKDGKITAQGEAVQKVLVDGEEFFSDDPTIVTKNMLSDAIDKVQVYDKKSDQAAFTGIDDGQKMKTIDLKLKADRKKGYFGKIEVGSDIKKYWNNSAMFNAFQGKRKFALYGITSNTGKTGLDFSESMNYGTSNMDMGVMDGGGMYINFGGGDEFDRGNYYGEGLPKGWNAGMLYSNKWNADKIALNGSYQFKKLNTEARGSTNSKYILPDTLYYINENGSSFSSRFRHSMNAIYEYQIDSSASLKITAQGYKGESRSISYTAAESLNEYGGMVNNSERRMKSASNNQSLVSNVLFRKKFKKTGRTLSVNVNGNFNENESDGFLDNTYNFFNELAEKDSTRRTDQEKLNLNRRSIINSRVTYTEPLSKRAILEFNYGLANNYGRSEITTLGKMSPGDIKYEDIIDSLSNYYSLNVLTNSAGINYRYAKVKKITLSFGGNVSKADFSRRNLKLENSVKYSFINFFPQANLNLSFGQRGSFYFNYFGNTQAPSIDQIQPIKDNTDELNQRIGNPNLKQAFRQRFNVSYNSYKFLSERSIYTNFGYSPVFNDFSTLNYIAPNGARISQPINVQGNYNLYGNIGYFKKFKKPDLGIGLNGDLNRSRNTNYLNNQKNITYSYSFGIRPRVSFDKEKKFEISLSPRIGYNFSRTSTRPDIKTSYWTQDYNAYAHVFLPWKLELHSDVQMSFRQKTDAFPDNNNAIRWNANLDKKILKNDAGILRFSAFDILNQNIGFQRNITSNFISERTYDTFQRYFMLSVIWNFSKNGKPQQW